MRTGGSAPFRIAGAVLLVTPFLPLRRVFGPLAGAGALVAPGEWLLGLGILAVVSWLLVLGAPERLPATDRLQHWVRALPSSSVVWKAGGGVVLLGILIVVSRVAFGHVPNHLDGVVQLFQAKIFSGVALTAAAPPGGGFFSTPHMLIDEGGWYSQYPPGHPAFLALGVLVGVPWLMPLLATLGSAAFLFMSVRRMYGDTSARLTLGLLVVCPFFWFMGASFMNHVSTLLFVSLFLYSFVRWVDAGSAGWALASGLALGAAALSRPLTAVALGVPFAVFALAGGAGKRTDSAGAHPRRDGQHEADEVDDRELRRGDTFALDRARAGHLTHFLAAAAGFAAVSGLYLVYNWAVTGDPLLPGYLKLWGESHGLGFHETPWGGVHTPLDGLRNELVDVSLLNVFLFEWPVPSLLPVGLVFTLGWTRDRWDRLLLTAFLALPAAYFFYWHRDAYLGPRFLYSGAILLVPLTARAIQEILSRARGVAWQWKDMFRPVTAGRWVMTFAVLCVGYTAFYAAPERLRAYAGSMSSMKVDLMEEAREAGIHRGLIFVKVSWGNRLISRMRGEGAGASLAERAYRGVDHCRLDSLVRQASTAGWDQSRFRSVLEEEIAAERPTVRTARLNGDPTLRLRPNRELSGRCADQVAYDQTGYTVFTPHLPANSPELVSPYVVARDLRALNRRLVGLYPDLPVYVWNGSRFERQPPHRWSR